AKLAGGHLHVLLAHGAQDIAGGEIARRHLVRIEPETHGVIEPAEHTRLRDTADAGEAVDDLEGHIVRHVINIARSVRGEELHGHGEVRRALLRGDTEAAHVLRKARERGIYTIL